jgi:hypothetical protein
MYPYQPHSAQPEETAVRGVLPEQRPPLDAALLDEPTSEVPMLQPPADTSWGDTADMTETPDDPERPQAEDATTVDVAASPEAASTAEADEAEVDDTDLSVSGPLTSPTDPEPNVTDMDGAADTGDAEGTDSDEAAALETGGEDDQEAADSVAATETEPDMQTLTEPVGPEAHPQESSGQEATAPAERRPGDVTETPIALWSDEAAEQLRQQWRELQVQFIDDPAEAVAGAKELVTAAVHQLVDTLQSARDTLDPYRDGDPVDTETMRVTMRRYREFLDRVLAL